jgi:hypothetical protein
LDVRPNTQTDEDTVKVAFLGCLGLFLGAILGGVIGIGAGMLYVSVFHVTDFEGYSGMLVFMTFMPIGAIVGGLLGGVGLGLVGSKVA